MYNAKYSICSLSARTSKCERTVDGYDNVDVLKSDTANIIEDMIESYKIPDGIANIEMLIERDGEYVDCDSGDFMIESGKFKII